MHLFHYRETNKQTKKQPGRPSHSQDSNLDIKGSICSGETNSKSPMPRGASMLFKGPLNQSKDAPSADWVYLQYSSVHRTLPRAGLHTEFCRLTEQFSLQQSHGPCLAPGNIQQVTQHNLATKRVTSSFQASLPLTLKTLKPSLISLSCQLLSWATNIPDRLNKFYFAVGQKQLSTEN